MSDPRHLDPRIRYKRNPQAKVSSSYPPTKPRDGSCMDKSCNSCHGSPTPETNGFGENGVHGCRHMAHVVLADLAGTVGQSIREHTRAGSKVTLGFLLSYQRLRQYVHLLVTILIGINYASQHTFFVMLNLQDLSVRPHLKISSSLSFRNVAICRRPLRTKFTSLKTKASLLAISTTIPRLTIDGHPTRVNVFIPKVFCTSLKHLIVVISWQSGIPLVRVTPRFSQLWRTRLHFRGPIGQSSKLAPATSP